jgi:hypothetical protein
MVLYGIKVSNPTLISHPNICSLINAGEANRYYNADKYVCSFTKMIQHWRQIWHNRTNGLTDIQFPFGFVQVKVSRRSFKIHFFFS